MHIQIKLFIMICAVAFVGSLVLLDLFDRFRIKSSAAVFVQRSFVLNNTLGNDLSGVTGAASSMPAGVPSQTKSLHSETSYFPSKATSEIESKAINHFSTELTSQLLSETTSQLPAKMTSHLTSEAASQLPIETTNQLPSETPIQYPSVTTQLPFETPQLPSNVTAPNATAEGRRGVSCQFPVLNPWDKSILSLIGTPSALDCDALQPPLSWLDVDGRVHLNRTQAEIISKINNTAVVCSWRAFDTPKNSTSDDEIYYSEPQILADTPTQSSLDGTEVKCHLNETEIYLNYHVHPTDKVTNFSPPSEEKLSLLLFGIDSASQSLVKRHLPKTLKYVQDTFGATIFKGHHKLADNTFPNMVPLLSGKRIYEQQPDMPDEGNFDYRRAKWDSFPLIWKNFSVNGYVTSFVEEEVNIGLFHFGKDGFARKPTDYYFRSYYLALRDSPMWKDCKWYCWGDTPNILIQLDMLRRIMKKYALKQRLFNYWFHSELSHNHEGQVEVADEYFRDFFAEMHGAGFLNKTVVIFMGDHGHRFSSIRQTVIGQIEERMPFFSLWFPDWFYLKYPHIKGSLEANSWRLTTHFDVHETLGDILHSRYNSSQRPLQNRGLSLLYELPKNRTCQSAGVPEHYCVCNQPKSIPITTPNVLKAADYLVNFVNELLANYTDSCAKLKLDKILHAEQYETNPYVVQGMRYYNATVFKQLAAEQNSTKKLESIRVAVKVSPSGAMLETLVQFSEETLQPSIRNDVDRINAYGDQSVCMPEHRLKKYCYCLKKS